MNCEMHAGNKDVRVDSSEVSDGNEEHVTGNWWESNPCPKMAEDLVDFFFFFLVFCGYVVS